MNDPRVEKIYYRLETIGEVTSDNPPPLRVLEESFEGILQHDRLTVMLHEHFASVDEGRWEIEPFLDHATAIMALRVVW
jgi:hypothetical protein